MYRLEDVNILMHINHIKIAIAGYEKLTGVSILIYIQWLIIKTSMSSVYTG